MIGGIAGVKSKWHREMAHHSKENFKTYFIACGRSDVTVVITTMRAVSTAIKWATKHISCPQVPLQESREIKHRLTAL
jgi:hypothetical protein